MSHPSSLSGAFRKPFPQQIAFFRNKLKNLVPTQRWDDLTGEAHDTAFMVAGAAKADLLTDLAAATDKAIAEGRGIEEFRRDFRDIVKRNGWTGWTGEGSVKGEAWRVKTILRTNAYTSYSAGRHAQLLDGDFAFWVYRHGDAREPRLVHLSFNGLALPPGHPFWGKYYPPSDWGCSCYVVGARTAAGVRRLGGDPGKALPANWAALDPRTGEPKGIGKGWGYAPGASVAPVVQALAGKIGSWDYRIAKAFMEGVPEAQRDALAQAYRSLPSTADDVRRYAQRVYEPKPDLAELPPQRTLGLIPGDQAATIGNLIDREIAGYDFSIDQSGVGHVIGEHGPGNETDKKQRAVDSADFARLPMVLQSPGSVTLSDKLSDMGETVIDYTKAIDGEEWHVRMAVRGKKRRTLALKTMFIVIGK